MTINSADQRQYIAIDLKSFYASVECVDRGFDPLTTNLVVADASRTEKTICLAVSPSLKAYGIGGRARLFEVVQRVREVNYDRKRVLLELRDADAALDRGFLFVGRIPGDKHRVMELLRFDSRRAVPDLVGHHPGAFIQAFAGDALGFLAELRQHLADIGHAFNLHRSGHQ